MNFDDCSNGEMFIVSAKASKANKNKDIAAIKKVKKYKNDKGNAKNQKYKAKRCEDKKQDTKVNKRVDGTIEAEQEGQHGQETERQEGQEGEGQEKKNATNKSSSNIRQNSADDDNGKFGSEKNLGQKNISGAAFAKSVAKRAHRAASPEPPASSKITMGSDCAGYGSDFIALELLHVGATLVFVAEKDAGKRELLEAAHPNVDFNKITVYLDVTKRDNNQAPYVDIFCTGAPCQPWSQAGEKQGLEDLQGRGVVLFHSLEYVRCKRPRVVVIENVKGLSHQPNKHVLDSILCAMKDLGYTVDWKIIDTKDHGIPHSRPRLYLVGVRSRYLVRAWEFPGRLHTRQNFDRFIDVDNKGSHDDHPDKKCFDEALAKAVTKHGAKKLADSWLIIDVASSETYSNSKCNCVPCITKSRGRSVCKLTIPLIY